MWATLLTLPWSLLIPVDALDRVDPTLTGMLGPVLIGGAILLNAGLLHALVRWLGRRRKAR